MRMAVGPLDTLLITGLGPVGLGALTIAKLHGARVIAVDTEPWRRDLAREMGADETLDASEANLLARVLDLTKGRGVDKAIDCSGNPAAERLCVDATTVRGWVAFIGENPNEIPLGPSRDLIRKGLTLIGSWHYNVTSSRASSKCCGAHRSRRNSSATASPCRKARKPSTPSSGQSREGVAAALGLSGVDARRRKKVTHGLPYSTLRVPTAGSGRHPGDARVGLR